MSKQARVYRKQQKLPRISVKLQQNGKHYANITVHAEAAEVYEVIDCALEKAFGAAQNGA